MNSGKARIIGTGSDALFLVGAVLVLGAGLWVWLTGQVAALMFGFTWIDVGIDDLVGIVFALPTTLADPAVAWPVSVRDDLPGPVGFTIAALIAGALITVASTYGIKLLTRFTSSGSEGMASAADIDRKLSAAAALRKARRLRPSLEGKATLDHVAVHLGKAVGSGKRVMADIENSVLVLAAPRQGKSSQIVIPWLARWQGPALATSVRPDIVEATYTIRAQDDRPVAVLDLSDTPWPDPLRWNPVAGCEDYDKARRRAKVMIGTGESTGDSSNAEFFRNNGINLLAGWLHAAALDGRGLDDVTAWALDETEQQPMTILKRAPSAARGVEGNLHSMYRLAPETRGSLFATVQTALAPMLSDRARRVFCPGPNEHFDIERFIRESGTIYLLAPQTNTSEVAPLISALVDEYTECAVRFANTSLGNRLDPPPGLFLDEVANIAPLEHLPELMSYAAGSGIFVCAILQEFAQARGRWGADNAEIMWGNATVKIALGALAAEDAQRFADEAGRYWAQIPGMQYGPGGTSHSPRTELREVMLASEVRRLDAAKGEALVIAGAAAPVKTRMRPHYRSKDRRRFAASVEQIRQRRTMGAAVATEPHAASILPWERR